MAKYSNINSFNTLETLTVGSGHYQIFNLSKLQVQLGDLSRLPKSAIFKSLARKFTTF